jgi:hypothetical protein
LILDNLNAHFAGKPLPSPVPIKGLRSLRRFSWEA